MRMSRAITVTLLSAALLTACCVSMSGCGRRAAPDHTWYDASGNPVEQKWKTDANGQQLRDAEGRPIPDPQVPYDRYHRPWVYTNGVWAPLPPPTTSSGSSYRSGSPGLWLWGGSGYRTTTSSPAYRSSGGSSSSSGGTSAPSGSSISRGGFGSTGMAASS